MPRLWTAQLWVSCCTAAFDFTEPLFSANYWHPPSVFGLTRIIQADIESFIFCFSIGGTAAVLYNVLTVQPIRIPPKTGRDSRREPWQALALLLPGVCYVPLLLVTNCPVSSGVIVTLEAAVVRIIRFHDLRAKTLLGGAESICTKNAVIRSG